jgi:hypothetical protein
MQRPEVIRPCQAQALSCKLKQGFHSLVKQCQVRIAQLPNLALEPSLVNRAQLKYQGDRNHRQAILQVWLDDKCAGKGLCQKL